MSHGRAAVSAHARVRLLIAIAGAVVLVVAAPFVGVVRSEIRTRFPGQFTLVINGAIATAVIAFVAAGLLRERTHRVVRALAFAGAVLLAAAYVHVTGSDDPAIRAVETFHFVEYGTITYLFYLAWRWMDDASALVLPAGAAFVVGIAEEAYQWFLPARVGELKDVWLNAVAILCGVVASVALSPPLRAPRWTRASTRRLLRLAAAIVVALAAFVHLVHLGVEVRDGHVTFSSRYTASELAALDAQRRAEWQARPPLVRPDRLSREDQFMTEGLQHVQARNAAWAAGDVGRAWHENGILERHFASVLDTPSYVAKTGHRWPPAQRAEAESRAQAAGASQPFTSDAYPYPIYTWSPIALWSVALGVTSFFITFFKLWHRRCGVTA